MFAKLVSSIPPTHHAVSTAPTHVSPAGIFVLVAVLLVVIGWMAFRHWKITLVVLIVGPIVLIDFGVLKLLEASGRS
jgi:hypothetical protein